MTISIESDGQETDKRSQGPRHRAPRPPLGPLRRGLRETGLALITLGFIFLLFVAYQLWGTSIAEQHSQAKLAGQFKAGVAANQAHRAGPDTGGTGTAAPATTAPTQTLPSVPQGGAIDHLVIPAIGVDKYVVEGTDEDDLQSGPGHYTGTPYPGQDGNVAIAGHRTTYGAPFFDLNAVKVGDPIYITDLTGRTWIYKVSQPPKAVSPNDVSVIDPTSFPELTLTTCNPRYSATSRLVVVARLQGQAQPSTPSQAPGAAARPASSKPATDFIGKTLPGADTTSGSAGNLGHGDSNAWPPTILYGLAVVVLWVGTRLWINRARRWHRAGAYVVGMAVCLVPLWFLFENVARLLPQSI